MHLRCSRASVLLVALVCQVLLALAPIAPAHGGGADCPDSIAACLGMGGQATDAASINFFFSNANCRVASLLTVSGARACYTDGSGTLWADNCNAAGCDVWVSPGHARGTAALPGTRVHIDGDVTALGQRAFWCTFNGLASIQTNPIALVTSPWSSFYATCDGSSPRIFVAVAQGSCAPVQVGTTWQVFEGSTQVLGTTANAVFSLCR